MKEYLSCFKYAFDFGGVASRKEYWSATLVNVIVWLVLSCTMFISLTAGTIILSIYLAISIIPIISLSVRRLHDADHYGYCLFWWFVPIAGIVIGIKQLCEPTKYNIY